MRYESNSKAKNSSKPTHKSPSLTSTSTKVVRVAFLNDNAHKDAVAKLGVVPGSEVMRMKELGVRMSDDDGAIADAFCEAASHTYERTWLVTKDKGRKDKYMPKVVDRKNREGYSHGTITYSPRLPGAIAKRLIDTLISSKLSLLYDTTIKNIHLSLSKGEIIVRATDMSNKKREWRWRLRWW